MASFEIKETTSTNSQKFYIKNYNTIRVENLNIWLGTVVLPKGYWMPHGENSSNMLVYKAERASRQLVKVNPKGTSKGLSYNDPYQDYISANRILDSGLGQPPSPRKTPYSASLP
ncbi:MAG TPA: hypothetical protein GXX31_04960 [Methanothermobacter sp.]|jgi:putative transposase|uniref:Uncharacterized protein n=1 Tax=Methanothermobacter tenebrarum TaxID=680118 RepID=A0ABN6PGQ0_9EURY|nr:transposase [Methanothermobacter tenebrarum]MDD3455138.1 hypothetical protein [Methanobacteriales archaeon]MDI6881527.1 hypothetical protein [Methanothermobacter sp.]MDX9693061.1 hypothetical protein [Methanothermobacter sp.]BDH79803.1 hypothetical protein MTTB_11820 [Methanothermobacter tenebrarum]HHW16709.1 hypothetical protein [Methanothermobacter sp.]